MSVNMEQHCECFEVPASIKEELANYLLQYKGFDEGDIEFDLPLIVEVGGQRLISNIDILVKVDGRPGMLVKIREGSVVSRERGVIAAARLFFPDYIIPVCVQTNGEHFSILDTVTKRLIGQSKEDLPSKDRLRARLQGVKKLPPKKRILEEKILYFYEALG